MCFNMTHWMFMPGLSSISKNMGQCDFLAISLGLMIRWHAISWLSALWLAWSSLFIVVSSSAQHLLRSYLFLGVRCHFCHQCRIVLAAGQMWSAVYWLEFWCWLQRLVAIFISLPSRATLVASSNGLTLRRWSWITNKPTVKLCSVVVIIIAVGVVVFIFSIVVKHPAFPVLLFIFGFALPFFSPVKDDFGGGGNIILRIFIGILALFGATLSYYYFITKTAY